MMELKMVYTVAELAKAAQMSTKRLRRLLASMDVPVTVTGPRSRYVFLTDLKAKMPSMWESLLLWEERQCLGEEDLLAEEDCNDL